MAIIDKAADSLSGRMDGRIGLGGIGIGIFIPAILEVFIDLVNGCLNRDDVDPVKKLKTDNRYRLIAARKSVRNALEEEGIKATGPQRRQLVQMVLAEIDETSEADLAALINEAKENTEDWSMFS